MAVAGSRTDPADVALSLEKAHTEISELEGKLAAAHASNKSYAMDVANARLAQGTLAEKLKIGEN